MQNKVSVIIPIYNVEQYLEKCLDSVINQTYKNLEILCVNDCSPDNCGKILEKYAACDDRIKIINREKNGGLSAARNTGLDNSTGEYVYFIDSDDWIDLDYIEKMVLAAKESFAKVVCNTNVYDHYEDVPEKKHSRIYDNRNSHYFINAHKAIMRLPWNTWIYLWERSFLNKIKASFPEGYIIEDIYFQATTFLYLDKVYVMQGSVYHYLNRSTSIMGKIRSDKFYPNLKILNKIVDYYEENNVSSDLKIRFIITAICPADKDREKFAALKKYFLRIKDRVNNNRENYERVELFLFDSVLEDVDKAMLSNYQKTIIFSALRKKFSVKEIGITEKNARCNY